MSDNKILILTNFLDGLFAFRKEVVVSLLDSGRRVWIACPKEEGEKADYFRNLGCEMVDTPVDRRGTNPLRDFRLLRQYWKLMRELRPSAVLTYTVKPNIYGGVAARLARVPQLANITGLGTVIENPGLLRNVTVAMYRFALRKAHTVFCQNVSIQHFCEEQRIGRKRVLIPGSGVNLDWHTLQPYPQPDSPVQFLFISRVMRDKGAEELLTAAQNVRKRHPEVEFHILGFCEDGYESRLRAACDAGDVIWHSYVPDVRPYLQNAWCTLLPSYHEGMANVLLESAAVGRPIITTDVSGCRETVDDGVTGLTCPARDAVALEEAIERFLRIPYEEKVQMGRKGREKMEHEFDRKKIVAAYLEALNG